MPLTRPVRIVRTLLVALLLVGPTTVFAGPVTAGAGHVAGNTAACTGADGGVKVDCMNCPHRSDSKRVVAAGCDAACPLLTAVLPLAGVSERPVEPVWVALPAPPRLGIARPVDLRPPKSSSPA